MRSNIKNNNVTPEMLAQLPFIEGELQVVSAKHEKQGEVYKLYHLTSENMEKATKLLTGNLMPTLQRKSRVYVLPNCMYTQVQIKELCKAHGFVITQDISRADLFVGNPETIIKARSEFPDALGTTEAFLFKYDMEDDFSKSVITSRYPHLTINTEADTLYFTHHYYNNIDSWSNLYNTGEAYPLISGEAVEILYRILSAKVPVVSETNLFNSIERLVIDAEMYNTLDVMLRASIDDKKIACELLFNANYEQSYYNIFKLCKEHFYYIDMCMNRSSKAVFYKTFNAPRINNYDYKQELDALYADGYLTEEIYQDITFNAASRAVKNLTESHLNAYKDFFAVDIFLKKSYEEYLESKKPKTNPDGESK